MLVGMNRIALIAGHRNILETVLLVLTCGLGFSHLLSHSVSPGPYPGLITP
jgi:hypothetical protein